MIAIWLLRLVSALLLWLAFSLLIFSRKSTPRSLTTRSVSAQQMSHLRAVSTQRHQRLSR